MNYIIKINTTFPSVNVNFLTQSADFKNVLIIMSNFNKKEKIEKNVERDT